MAIRPNIYEYSNLSSYLEAYCSYKRDSNPRWSLGVWSKKLGLKGSGTLSNFISGRRVPKSEILDQIKEDIKLSEYEVEYFDALVVVSLKNSDKILIRAARSLIADRSVGREYRELSDEEFNLISSPLAMVLRECVKLKGFRNDAGWIKKRLRLIQATEKQIQTAIDVLVEVGLLKHEGQTLVQSDAHYKTPSDHTSEALQSYYEEALDLNRRAVRELPNEARHLNSITICIDQKDLPELRKAIHQFNKRTMHEFDRKRGEVVYQVHTQLIPHAEGEI